MSLARYNPAQFILSRAASQLPKTTGETERYNARLAVAKGDDFVVLADVSASMAEMAGTRPKIDVLREALASAPPARIVAFSSAVCEVASPLLLPAPSGGTAMHLALDHAARMRPSRTLVISDGEPEDETKALLAAEAVPGVIDVLYCGSETNHAAINFMMRLARAGCGRYATRDIRKAPEQLAPSVRAMLTR